MELKQLKLSLDHSSMLKVALLQSIMWILKPSTTAIRELYCSSSFSILQVAGLYPLGGVGNTPDCFLEGIIFFLVWPFLLSCKLL